MSEATLTSPVPGLFVGGKWDAPASDREVVTVMNPATAEVIGSVVSATPTEAVSAAAAASAARAGWRAMPVTARAEILEQIAERLRHHRADLARTIVEENGKTLEEAEGEVDWACSFFHTYAEEGKRLGGRILAKVEGKQPLVLNEPFGVVLAITPWNDPLGMIARQIAPALAAGCTIVWKPASLTPLTATKFVDVVAEAGLPPGVLNLFVTSTSNACITSVLDSRLVQKVIFTGSTSTGLALAGRAAALGVPSNLELGGNAACIVLDDTDLERTVAGIVTRKFVQAGQGCTCVNRLFVQRGVEKQLLERLVERVSAIKLGSGLDPEVTMGPLIHAREVERLDALVADAVGAGANLLLQGERPGDASLRDGAFFAPHVLTGVTDEMQLARDESFGPVLPVLVFDDVEEAIRRANDVEHGLAGYVFGEPSRAMAVAHELEVGLVGVNDASPQAPYYPVGGTKASGWGVAGAHEGLMEYVRYKSVSVGDA
jgi:succinate-semialdehyde dehydrogenase/glutarate-semialdehyde dehydrogenase